MHKSIAKIALATAGLLAGCSLVATAQAAPEARVETGSLRGSAQDGVESFKGIPFAAPPLGKLRWHAPEPAAKWDGVRDATQYGADCMQKPFPSDAAPLGTAPSEDCLTLNVWRPEGTRAGAALPVLVWIYGGGFVNGGSSPDVYSGAALAQQGIVVVSFNYRIGRFGFFQHPALTAAKEGPVGNWGLMDQHAALEWVQRNIAGLGGDPEKVTIAGESAGGMSVMSLLGAPEVRGTFAKAVVMSGGGRASGPLREISTDQPNLPSAENVGLAFARSIGVEGTDAAALAKLRALPAKTILDDFNMASMFGGTGAQTFTGPVKDGITVVGTNEEVFARGEQARVPVMVGATSADIGFFPARDKDSAFAAFGKDAEAARAIYDPQGTGELFPTIMAIGGDVFMVEPSRFTAQQVTKAGEPAYFYRFAYVANSMREEWKTGAPHATDIPYFFDTVAAKYGDKLTPKDSAMADAMSHYLGSFVKSGSPNAPGEPAWPTFGQTQTTMNFAPDGQPSVGEDPWRKRLDLVEKLSTH